MLVKDGYGSGIPKSNLNLRPVDMQTKPELKKKKIKLTK